ncbi:MAG: hypothetical protein AB1749_06790 [Pseudomonadota bacterium]
MPSRVRSLTILLSAAVPLGLAVTALPAALPETLQLIGYSGFLGEWELSAELVRDDTGGGLSGPLTMAHVGLCSQTGPEVKSGVMRLTRAWFSSRVEARISIDGAECRYSGALSDGHTGTLTCSDRRPVPLTLWTK